MTSFRKLYSKYRSALQDGWQTGEVTSHFGPTASLDAMFHYLASLPEAQQILVPPEGDDRICRKGAAEAEKFRNEGNRFYKEKKLDKALLAYNYSILASPHPVSVDATVTGDKFEELALGYANRSALLYETAQYKAAVADIKRALRYGYPASKRHRLHERCIKCFLALGQYQEAKTEVDQAINYLTTLSLEDNETNTAQESLNKLLERCENQNASEIINNPSEDHSRLFYTGHTSPPTLISPQVKNRCLSDALRIAYTPARGRHLVAEREIKPGEVLIVEDSVCSVVKMDSTLRTHCANCLRRAMIPIPCPFCSLVVFCSEECRNANHTDGHGGECPALASIVALQLDPAPALALRVLSSMNLPILRAQVAELRRKVGSCGGGGGHKPFLQLTHDYQCLYHLEHHATARPETQLLETAALAYVLTQVLLEQCPKFLKSNEGNLIMPSEVDITMVGGQFMHLILGIECNVHCAKETQITSDNKENNTKENRGKEIGWAVFSALSLINHSCAPNALSTSLGNKKFLYSISIIPKGAEITDSYGERYITHPREERRKALQNHYFFCCGCAACQSDWPIFESLKVKPNLRCPSCCQVLVGFQCMICKLACTSDTGLKNGVKLYDAPSMQLQIGRFLGEFPKIIDELSSGRINSDLLSKIINILTLLDKYTVHPNGAYITAQESLMSYFDLMGSVHYTDKVNAP